MSEQATSGVCPPVLPLISIIMPAYNAAPFIREAIESTLAQSWLNWELLIVDNASTDETTSIVHDFNDERIHLLHEPERGVSRARNRALDRMKGDLYCFLDADDILPSNSLAARAMLLHNSPEVFFVDGAVYQMSSKGQQALIYTPTFKGEPFDPLLRISESAFFGPTWMIRRTSETDLRFPTHMSHAEDLAFYIQIARAGKYTYTNEPVLLYRTGHESAMSNLDGLWKGYKQLYHFAQGLQDPPNADRLRHLKTRIKSIMTRSYLKAMRPFSALKVILDPL